MVLARPRYHPKSLWSYNPIPTGCVLYLPLWHPNLHSSAFKSIDLYRHDVAVVGGVFGSDGWTADGDDRINIPDAPSLSGFTTLSVGVWMKSTDATAAFKGLAGKLGGIQDEWSFRVHADSGTVRISIYDESTGGVRGRQKVGYDIWDGAWRLLFATWDGGVLSTGAAVYDNGSQIDDATSEAGDFTAIEDKANPVQFGTASTNAEYFTGTLGDCWLYNVELSAAEILHIYQRTKGRYL